MSVALLPEQTALVVGVIVKEAKGEIHCTVTPALKLLSQFTPEVMVAVINAPAYTSNEVSPDSVHVVPETVDVPNKA
jgi:hypothetical protein